jgi:type VI protein secretion system component VasF
MQTSPYHPQMQDMLSAVTDAMLANESVDAVLARYSVPRAEVAAFLVLINRLHHAIVGVKPSRRFAMRLRQDLMGAPRMNVITRMRSLPPRVQIAAGIALVAGFMLLTRRRLIQDARLDTKSEAEALV